MNRMLALAAATVVASLALFPAAARPAPPAGVFLRVNQVGYLPEDRKIVLALTTASLEGREFRVETAAGAAAFTATVGADRGRYGSFAHLYELDCSRLAEPGVYRVVLGSDASPPFAVGADGYRALLGTTLRFFEVQRCGDARAALHGPCHLTDATAKGGPRDGAHVDVTGGWHDAGDYIKFLITQGSSTILMLQAYDRHPDAFRGAATIPPLLAEVSIGVEWIAKLWDGDRKVLYYQVGDASDHDVGWRLPEVDDAARPGRPAFACENGKGANVAGKSAAVLALAAVVWNDASAPYRDPERAARYVAVARQVYAYGAARPAAQPSRPSEFYGERSWVDDMALAAVELYRTTGEAKYLRDARRYAKRAGAGYSIDWGTSNGLAHYELARADASYTPKAVKLIARDLAGAREASARDPFGAALGRFFWGSASAMSGVALEALWYEDLTGDTSYRALAGAQRDYVLGANPWGVCFVSGAGAVWPHFPHHQIADIQHAELTGFWDEGPVRAQTFAGQGITLRREDAYAGFQTDDAVYHDDVEDYVTNEPTLDAAALGIAVTAWYASRR